MLFDWLVPALPKLSDPQLAKQVMLTQQSNRPRIQFGNTRRPSIQSERDARPLKPETGSCESCLNPAYYSFKPPTVP